MRHGLVVAGVCVGIAVVTGMSGYAFGERPPAAQGQTTLPARPGAATSQAVLSRWLRPLMDAPPAHRDAHDGADEGAVGGAIARATGAQEALQAGEIQTIERAMTLEVLPTTGPPDGGGLLLVRAHRAQVTPPRLAVGDRPLVTVSFYYCEESTGGYPSGDGGGFCGRARDGSFVRSGMAACDIAYLGQRFRIGGDPTGLVYVCADTGSAVHGMHRDIWFLDNRSGWVWQSQVGGMAVIEVLS